MQAYAEGAREDDRLQDFEMELFHKPLEFLDWRLQYDSRLERLWATMRRQFADPNLDLPRAARISGTSPNHLNRLLKERAGFTFKELLNRLRVYQGLRKMSHANLSIGDIAAGSGFAEIGTFRRNCVKFLGDNPKTLQRALSQSTTFFAEQKREPQERPASVSELLSIRG